MPKGEEVSHIVLDDLSLPGPDSSGEVETFEYLRSLLETGKVLDSNNFRDVAYSNILIVALLNYKGHAPGHKLPVDESVLKHFFISDFPRYSESQLEESYCFTFSNAIPSMMKLTNSSEVSILSKAAASALS